MKLIEYQTYDKFKTITFESKAGYEVQFRIDNSDNITLETERISLSEIKECIEIIDSGKLVIIL